MANNVYSFLYIKASIVGPGGAFSLSDGGSAEEGITIVSSNPINNMQMGADGQGQHSLLADRSGTVTIRLLKTSPLNQMLMDLYNFQTASSSAHGQNTLVINDASRGDVITCSQTAFQKAPDINYTTTAGINEWIFDSIKIVRTLGS